MGAYEDAIKKKRKLLLTKNGYLDAIAEIFIELTEKKPKPSRVVALTGARAILSKFAEERDQVSQKAQHKELISEMRQTREALKNNGTGVTRQTGNNVSLPRKASAGPLTN